MVSAANKVPFDVLCQIFDCYAREETLDYPLETLLLVSRSWAVAAQDYRRLWSMLCITLRKPQDLMIWRTRVPRRLARCSPDVHIRITQAEKCREPWYDDPREAAIYEDILSSLVGFDGKFARRWQTFSAITNLNKRALHEFLIYPTPKLEVFNVSWLQPVKPILPYTQVLKTISGLESYSGFLTDLSTVHDLEIESNDSSDDNLARARNVGWLTILNSCYRSCPFPGTLPFLTDLTLTYPAGNTPQVGGQLIAPALKYLTLHAASGTDLEWVVQCPGLPLGQLKEVNINSYYWFSEMDSWARLFKVGLRHLFAAMTNLRDLELHGGWLQSMAFKIIFDDAKTEETLFRRRGFKLRLKGHTFLLGIELNRCLRINSPRGLNGTFVGKNWEKFYDEIEHSMELHLRENSRV